MSDDTDPTEAAQLDDQSGSRATDDASFAPAQGGGPRPPDGSGALAGLRFEDVLPKVYWIGIGLCVIVALATLEEFYAHATAAIERLVTPEYADLFLAGFNLLLLLLIGLAASLLVRQLVALEERA